MGELSQVEDVIIPQVPLHKGCCEPKDRSRRSIADENESGKGAQRSRFNFKSPGASRQHDGHPRSLFALSKAFLPLVFFVIPLKSFEIKKK
jgi:hypothetical protein